MSQGPIQLSQEERIKALTWGCLAKSIFLIDRARREMQQKYPKLFTEDKQ